MAGLIPQHFIDELLDRTDIVDVIDSRINLRKTGRNYSALCPFHQEKSPSFSVNPDKQFYYCFGCGAGGNAIGFVMEYDRLDFRATVEDLARRAGMEIPQDTARDPQQDAQKRGLYQQLEAANEYYQQQLREHSARQRAVEYLKGRGLTGEVARDFGIGYAPPGWDNLHSELVKDANDERQLVESGMLIEKKSEENSSYDSEKPQRRESYDRFRDRIMFPIRDSRGRVIAFGGRVLGDDKPKYLNSPDSPVFHKGRELYGLYEARQANNRLSRFVIVEGYMDVVALAQHGIPYAVATLGTATSETHLQKLFRMAPELVFSFDGDEAGRKAAHRALETTLGVMEDGRQVRFLFLPEGEDPDTLVRKEGADGFTKRMEQALPFSEFFFNMLCEQVDMESIDGKAHLSKLALPLIKKMPPGALQHLMLSQLSQLTGLDQDHLQQLLRQQQTPRPTNDARPSRKPDGRPIQDSAPPQSRNRNSLRGRSSKSIDSVAYHAIHLLLQNPEMAQRVTCLENLRSIEDDHIQLLVAVLDVLVKQPKLNTAVLLSHWHGKPEQEDLIRLAARESLPIGMEIQFDDAIRKLAQSSARVSLDQLHELIKTGSATDAQKLEYRELLANLNTKNS